MHELTAHEIRDRIVPGELTAEVIQKVAADAAKKKQKTAEE